MPRDLFSSRRSDEPALTASPETQTPRPNASPDQDAYSGNQFTILRDDSEDRELQISNTLRTKDEKRNLHPYVQILSLSDLEACIALDNAAFPEIERCSREKFVYRLTACPTLSLGLFSSTSSLPTPETQAAHDAARPPDSSTPSHRALLLAMVSATLTASPVVTEASIKVPDGVPSTLSHQTSSLDTDVTSASDFQAASPSTRYQEIQRSQPARGTDSEQAGHNLLGRTIAIHSLCVLPSYQHLGLGRIVLEAYMQRLESSGIADRMALLAHPELVGWYTETFGFVDKGESMVRSAGGGWRNMVYEVVDHGPGS